jgi:hypothetical protein
MHPPIEGGKKSLLGRGGEGMNQENNAPNRTVMPCQKLCMQNLMGFSTGGTILNNHRLEVGGFKSAD